MVRLLRGAGPISVGRDLCFPLFGAHYIWDYGDLRFAPFVFMGCANCVFQLSSPAKLRFVSFLPWWKAFPASLMDGRPLGQPNEPH